MPSLIQAPVTAASLQEDIRAIARIEAVPRLLKVICETTGMGFAAVARVTDEQWITCAAEDRVSFGLVPGAELPLASTLCHDVRSSDKAIFIDHASQDPVFCTHHTPRLYQIESYASVPIRLSDGEYFGNLCAIDAKPHGMREPRVVAMFELFAQLIALQLESDRARDRAVTELTDERAAGELREQFIAVLGHDLRNPLAAIAMGATVLRTKAADPTAVTAIASRVERSAKRMSALIDDVLDFARGRLGSGIGVEFVATESLGKSLAAVVAELHDAQPDREIVADIALDGLARCDPGRLEQLLSNLLANALTHGRPDAPVRVRAAFDGGDVVIEVHNEGDPIPADRLEKVFAPFWRRTVAREGLGLGLYICSQIARSHGGKVTVQSTADLGTSFVARLPIRA